MARERQSWKLFAPPQDQFANIQCYLTDREKHQGVGGMIPKAKNPPPLQGRGVLNALQKICDLLRNLEG